MLPDNINNNNNNTTNNNSKINKNKNSNDADHLSLNHQHIIDNNNSNKQPFRHNTSNTNTNTNPGRPNKIITEHLHTNTNGGFNSNSPQISTTPTRFRLSPSHKKSLSLSSPTSNIHPSAAVPNLTSPVSSSIPSSFPNSSNTMHNSSSSFSHHDYQYTEMNTGSSEQGPPNFNGFNNGLPLPLPKINKKPRTIVEWFKYIRVVYPNAGITTISIVSWYLFSLSISLYNKWMFGPHLNFQFPIIITSFHQLLLFCLSCACLSLWPSLRLNYGIDGEYTSIPNKEEGDNDGDDDDLEEELEDVIAVDDEERLNSQYDEVILDDEPPTTTVSSKTSYFMSVREYLTKILPCAIASAGDIGLGNTSFRFISLSLYTMIKTSSLVFVLLWGVIFKLERMNVRIVSIVVIMTFGVLMMIWGQDEHGGEQDGSGSGGSDDEPINNNTKQYGQILDDDASGDDNPLVRLFKRDNNQSHLVFIGCILVLVSACMSGLRWALTQIMLKRNKRTKNPILTIFYISPLMSLILIVIGSCVEGFINFLNSQIWVEKGVLLTIVLVIIPGFLAFFMTISEFVLLQYSSLLTLSIAGIFKELLTIFLGWLIFDDHLSFINLIGLVVTLSDIIWYNMYRFNQSRQLENSSNFNKLSASINEGGQLNSVVPKRTSSLPTNYLSPSSPSQSPTTQYYNHGHSYHNHNHAKSIDSSNRRGSSLLSSGNNNNNNLGSIDETIERLQLDGTGGEDGTGANVGLGIKNFKGDVDKSNDIELDSFN